MSETRVRRVVVALEPRGREAARQFAAGPIFAWRGKATGNKEKESATECASLFHFIRDTMPALAAGAHSRGAYTESKQVVSEH